MNDEMKRESHFEEQPEAKKRRQSFHARKQNPLYYHSYLQLDSILNAQRLESADHPKRDDDSLTDNAMAAKSCPYAHLQKNEDAKLPTVLPKEVNEENKSGAHDEHLFIVIHQTYELWFKQSLWEINSVRDILNVSEGGVSEKSIGLCVARLGRVSEILKVLVSQLTVLETMTPLSYTSWASRPHY